MARIKVTERGAVNLWLSADDTYRWAHRSGRSWPAATLSGHRVYAKFEPNGDLVDMTVDGRYSNNRTGMFGRVDVDGSEFTAMTDDFLASSCPAAGCRSRRGRGVMRRG